MYTNFWSFSVLLCQKEESCVCSKVIHTEARGEYSGVPGAQ